MTITYPTSLPLQCFPVVKFEIDFPVSQSRTRGGLVQARNSGRALWMAEFTTSFLRVDVYETFKAWLAAQEGGTRTFVAYDPFRKRPRAYPGVGWSGFTRHAGGAFDGTATVTAVTAYTVTISGLPSTYQFKAGDMISWVWGSTRTLHRVVADVAAVNGVATVEVRADVPSGVTYPVTCKLEAADAVFRLLEVPDLTRELTLGQPITIKGVQYLG